MNTVTLDKPIVARADGQRRTPGDAVVAGTSHTMLITWSGIVIVPLGRKPGCSNLVLPRLLEWLCHKGATTVQGRCATDRQ